MARSAREASVGEGYKVMEVKIEYRGDNEVRFVVSGSDVNVRFVNSLRRAMIAEVPKLAMRKCPSLPLMR